MRGSASPELRFRRLRLHAHTVLAYGVLAALAACSPAVRDRSSWSGAGSAAAGTLRSIGVLSQAELGAGERLRVIATTSIVGDLVTQVGGEAIELTVLLPPGSDPHGYVASPRDLAAISSAHLLLVSGFGLEEGLGGVLEQVSAEVPVVSISEGVTGRPMREEMREHQGDGFEEELDRAGTDPHVWFDPTIVMHWTRNAAAALGALNPDRKAEFQENADGYVTALQALDERIRREVTTLPPERRVLITDHLVFGYFADRYGFDVVGAVIPAYSSGASASPQDVAALLQTIQEHGVNAVFVGVSANPDAAQALADDADVQVVRLYTESLSEARGPAASYLAMMEYNARAIVEALR